MADEPAQKLTPIIVTTKKIISLKKKAGEQSAQASGETVRETHEKPVRPLATGRKIPTATIHPEAKRSQEVAPAATTAIVKPVLKQTSNSLSNDFLDEYDEDELLADSPPPSPVHVTKTSSSHAARATQSSAGGLLSNRRIVVRNTSPDEPVGGKKLILLSTSKARAASDDHTKNKTIDVDEIKNIVQSTTSTHNKGIFDRLDKKLVGVNDAAKRKLQRIVINNSE